MAYAAHTTQGGGTRKQREKGKARHKDGLKAQQPYKRPNKARGTTEDTPLTELRQNIRGLEKLLAHDSSVARSIRDGTNASGSRSMPSHIRQEKERALAGYKHDLDLAVKKRESTKEYSKQVSKYHHVRFYERKKAERQLKKAEKAWEAGTGSEDAVLRAKTDLNYALYLPLSEKYISLFPRTRGEDPDNVRESSGWRTIRDIYQQSRANGLSDEAIEANLLKVRDGGWFDTFGVDSLTTKPSQVKPAVKGIVAEPPATGDVMDEAEDADEDGFFEKPSQTNRKLKSGGQ